MFPWNIAKSAEALFSRWAVKRVCKFLLKKKLGQFILGDIDLNQLDVQLTAGTIQLSDLALNVDYLNHKLGSSTLVMVKEGSIGSLLVTMPWKGEGCQIVVDELELVFAPHGSKISKRCTETCALGEDGKYSVTHDMEKVKHVFVDNVGTAASVDVHEGVKTIAKMVKWLLTSFHVKIKKMIVAFDPCLKEEKDIELHKTLVLRITEAECGTCISEDVDPNSGGAADDFLGLSQLTNIVKFEGVTLEFLQTDGINNQAPFLSASGTAFGECLLGRCSSNATTTVVTGERGGFSGTLKLSIPWKNGSLDICKVDANAYIDPLELKFRPSSIQCFLSLWDALGGKASEGQVHQKATASDHYSVASTCHLSTMGSCVPATDYLLPKHKTFSAHVASMGKETFKDALLPASCLISDWVPSSVHDINNKDRTPEEPDFGASMDQFFECFDGLRSSQSALGNSGIWNWTCSVFSSITTASNLASGSLHIQSEQQHVEANLKATVAGISVLFDLDDEGTEHLCGSLGSHANPQSHFHYMVAKLQQMHLVLQVCPREMNFEVTVQHTELTDHFSNGDGIMDIGCHGCPDDSKSQFVLIQEMQDAVEGALPPFCSSVKEKSGGRVSGDFPYGIADRGMKNYESVCRDDEIKVTLFKTSGSSWCQFTINSSSNDSFSGPKSWSLKLPQFVLWVNFPFLSVASDLLKKVENSFEMTSRRTRCDSEASDWNCWPSSQGYAGETSYPQVTSLPQKENVRGNIFIPNARVILCFPFDKGRYSSSDSCWEQFIAFDLSSPSVVSENVQATCSSPTKSSKSWFRFSTASSLHLNLGNLNIHWINSTTKHIVGSDSLGTQKLSLFAKKILSLTGKTGHPFLISLLWQEGPVTGPWIAKKAKSLAASEDLKSRDKFMAKGYEFASVSTMKNLKDSNAYMRQEIILSSAFFLHACLPPVTVNLSSSLYNDLYHVVHQGNDWLASTVSDTVGTGEEFSRSQTSILLECDSMEISVSLEGVENIKSSIQNELPGSWHGFRLQVQKFEFLSVSNIGGIKDANLFWAAHGEGSLWGSITEVPDRDILLISCSNSTMGRGDGEGSNVLSSIFSGSDIVHLWDPENCCIHTSITIRCATIVAVGGRLDWLESIFSFFSSPLSKSSQVGENSLQKEGSDKISSCGSSFVLSLVDIGLSYEPFLTNAVVGEGFDPKSSSVNVSDNMGGKKVACLLSASSFKISNTVATDSIDRDYKIRVQDLGLLLCAVSKAWNVGDSYSVAHLRKIGYVKVAQETHLEALLMTNCENGLSWQLECAESHIVLGTSHDTASGLICLASQMQQLFAPDVGESVVHLQTRWNNVQQAHEGDVNRTFSSDSAPSTSRDHTSFVDAMGSGVVNLMDEICEDEFKPGKYSNDQTDIFESQIHNSLNDSLLREGCNSSIKESENFSTNLSLSGSVPVITLESSDTSKSQKSLPGFIEGYFLSDLRPRSEFSPRNQSSNEVPKAKYKNMKDRDAQVGNGGWYEDASLRILENHVSEVSERACSLLSVEDRAHGSCTIPDEGTKVKGRIVFKSINILWKIYAGFDWHGIQENLPQPPIKCGRDTTKCLELVLSGIDFQYDVFPEGEIFVSRLSLSVQDFWLSDSSKNAPWKLVLGYYQSKDRPRKSSSKAFKLDMEAVRPDPLIPLEEYRLRMAFLPMLLHLHQSQLDFLISFLGGKGSSADSSPGAFQDSSGAEIHPKRSAIVGGHTINEEALLPYFQKFDIWPLLIRVDYSPCRVDLAALRDGKYVELVNLVPWKGVELQLKHVQGIGVYGWSCVCETIVGKWLEDISQNQVHKLLKGLPPIRSLVTVSAGAAKLVSLPLKSYKKDHRLVKGMQRGTVAFLRSISLEAIGLGVHLAAGAHDILLQAEYILTSIPPSVPWPAQNGGNTNIKSNQPQDACQGIRQAYESISEGIGKSVSALVGTPMKRHQRNAGVWSALATAVKAAPSAAVVSASTTARAVHCTLLGVRNSLDPEHKKESMDKYLGVTQPREFSG